MNQFFLQYFQSLFILSQVHFDHTILYVLHTRYPWASSSFLKDPSSKTIQQRKIENTIARLKTTFKSSEPQNPQIGD